MKHFILTLSLLIWLPFLVSSQITQEHLDVAGAITIQQSVLPTPIAGTIEWDGANFRGYDGSLWLPLDNQTQNTWIIAPGPFGLELTPAPMPAGITIPIIGPPNPGGWIYAHTAAGPIAPHLIALEDVIGVDASMLFSRMGQTQYSLGLDQRGYYVIAESPVLPPPPPNPALSSYGNQQTALEIQPGTGIVNMPRQSKAKAWLSYPQFIPTRIWTPIIFDQIIYDEHNEFTITPTPAPPSPGGAPETSYFTATEEGWYHVEARCEFNTYELSPDWIPFDLPPEYFYLDTVIIDSTGVETLITDTICYMGPGWQPLDPIPLFLAPEAWVSIGIFSGGLPGFTNIHSQGNNLQIAREFIFPGIPEPVLITFDRNNAPNVSGLVHLKKGQIISIWVWHTAESGMNLQTWYYPGEEIPGPLWLPGPQYPHESKVYVSIAKVN